MYSRIAGTGSYLPEKVVSNFDLEKTMDTTDEWIRTRTGIERRHLDSNVLPDRGVWRRVTHRDRSRARENLLSPVRHLARQAM